MSQIFQIRQDSYNIFLFLLPQRREIALSAELCLCLFLYRYLCEEIIEVELSFALGFEYVLSNSVASLKTEQSEGTHESDKIGTIIA